MTKTMTILRGLPGSGKSTYCRNRWFHLTPADWATAGWDTVSVSADHFFEDPATGDYNYDPTKIGLAHATALCHLIDAVTRGVETIVVDNTHVQAWEWAVAMKLGETHGYTVEVVDLFDGGKTNEELAERNTHRVPLEVIRAMRAKWQATKIK